MKKLYEFSKESIRKAEAARELGFDTIGKTTVSLNKNHSIVKTFMRNARDVVPLDNKFFPEIPPDEEVTVLYIINYERCNWLYRKSGMDSDALSIKEQHQILLEELAQRHAIWIRDVYFKMHEFKHGIPWPMANLLGKAYPIFDFIECFNPIYAHEGYKNVMKEEAQLENMLLQDYFKEGEEGFTFPVFDEILCSKERFNECLDRLYKKYPHLK